MKTIPRIIRNPLFMVISLCAVFILGIVGQLVVEKLTIATPKALSSTQIYESINTYRVENGLNSLHISTTLENGSYNNVEDILRLDYWSTESPEGKRGSHFVEAAGYQYEKIGTMLYIGNDSTEEILRKWKSEVSLNAYLLGESYTEIGGYVGCGFDIVNYKDVCIVIVNVAKPVDPSLTDINTDESFAKPKSTPKIANNDNIKEGLVVNCIFPHSGTITMSKEDCDSSIDCEVGNTWSIFPSKDACNKAQRKFYEKNLGESFTEYTDIPEIPDFKVTPSTDNRIECKIYYLSSNTTATYNLDPDTCLQYQNEQEAINDAYLDLLDTYKKSAEDAEKNCKSNAEQYYEQQVRNCQIQYGATSVEEACNEIYDNALKSALKDCEN